MSQAASTDGIRQLKHSSWTNEEGAPSNITDLAQSAEGYLLIGARDGLYRFDGVTFEHIQLADPSKASMSPARILVTRAGTIWVALGGRLFVYRHGQLHAVHGPVFESISHLKEGPDGAIWLKTIDSSGGVYRYWHGRFEPVGANWGVPKGWIASLLVARSGGIWMAGPGTLFYLHPGSRRFQMMDAAVGLYGGLAEDAKGNIWFSSRSGTNLVRDAATPLKKPAKAIAYPPMGKIRGATPMIDRSGALWGSSWSNGIFRIPLGMSPVTGGAVDSFGARDGLTSDVNETILEDREGNIWVGTQRGLDRFRPTPVTMEPAIEPNPDGYMIAQDGQGSVYIAATERLYEILPGGAPRNVAKWPEPINTLCSSRDGSIWIPSEHHLGRFFHNALHRVRRPGGVMESWGCREDRDGRLWFLTAEGSVVVRHPDGRWLERMKAAADYSPFIDIALDGNGDVVVKWGTKNVSVLRGGAIDTLPQATFGVNRISGLTEARTGLFIAGDGRLGRWRGNRNQTLDTRKTYPWLSMRGMVQTPNGESWLIGSNGILRISTSRLDYAFDHPGASLPYQRFDVNDGLRAGEQHTGYRGAQVAQGGDGRIWFLTASGVARVDPADLKQNLLPPQVAIRSLSARGRSYVDPANIMLPSGTTALGIAYTALSLAVPTRVRFRYQLEGVDDSWIDPGARREAFYTNLRPGRYRFRVIASNNDGVWNRTGATLAFEIRPAFYQTWWFLLLCLLPGIGLVRVLYAMRLGQVAGRVRHEMETRLAERERIARELHDTLLQSFQGVSMFFQSIVDRFPPDSPLRHSIGKGLDLADAALTEGRERVRELRRDAEGQGFGEAVLRNAAALITDDKPHLSVSVKGAPRSIVDLVSDELLRLIQEAVRNAVQHADANIIEILVEYRAWTLAVTIRDDGAGVPDSVLDRGNPVGHYGILGMRERAARIGGRFMLRRWALGGTEIVASVAARVAYRDAGSAIPNWLRQSRWRAAK
jgi:ligand-binding sensor domain-containing protein/signal transduction histidine kinase